ncbi:MAG: 30S ribosomal protein S16 [Akkermansiaceae bacterium]|nr:30S ribosomal protein S16 [Armatimonadota bacterium]
MSVKIRLRRDGAKKRPFYHVVAADSRRARDGRYIEQLGYYNPIVAADTESIVVLKEDRVRYWLSVGAQPSDTAAALLKRQGLMERSKPRAVKAAPVVATEATAMAEPLAETAEPAPADSVAEDAPEASAE